MSTCHISALEEYCHEQAGVTPNASSQWLLINLLDELTTGRLAHRAIQGRLCELDDILEHDFWVFGLMRLAETNDVQAFFRPFSPRSVDVPMKIRRLLKRTIVSTYGHPSEAERAGEIVERFGNHTIAALSVGEDPEGALCVVLYWHPFFTADIAVGLLQTTVAYDDADR